MYSRVFLVPRLVLLCLAILSAGVAVCAQQNVVAQPTQNSISILDSTREQDGLSGPVRRVHTEMTKVTVNAGKIVEEPRMLLEVTTYDPQGKRISNVYYPVASGSFKGNQEFTYDEQGHVKEMTLRDDTGRVLSREGYTYEIDSFGNWTKMSSSFVIFEGGKLVSEPFEITYRTISYYFDDSVAQIVKSSSSTVAPTSNPPVVAPSSNPPAATTPADKSKSVRSETASGAAPIEIKQKPLTSPPESALPVPANTSPNTNAVTEQAKVDKPRDEAAQPKREVDVAANPTTTQAYQMPAEPIASGTPAKQAVSGGVLDGKVISLPKPVYPAVAQARGVFGKVVIEVTLDEKGHVIEARALSGNPLLKATAISAARLARFEPTLLSGQPVKATRLINYDFRK